MPLERRHAIASVLALMSFVAVTTVLLQRRTELDFVDLEERPNQSLLHLPRGVKQPGSPESTLDEILAAARLLSGSATAQCPAGDEQRIRYYDISRSEERLLVVADLYNNQAVLPTIMEQLIMLTSFIGPNRLHVAIYENGSDDATPQLLGLLARSLHQVGVRYTIYSDGRDVVHEPDGQKRIHMLAHVRNQLIDLVKENVGFKHFSHVIWLNDVFHCAVDILELVRIRNSMEADMVTGMDYYSWESRLYFRDLCALQRSWI